MRRALFARKASGLFRGPSLVLAWVALVSSSAGADEGDAASVPWVHVGGNGWYGCALHATGRVGCWGGGRVRGRLGDPAAKTAFRSGSRAKLGRDDLRWVPGITAATRLSVAERGACAVNDGTATCWGWDQDERVDLGPAVDVATSDRITCVVRPGGRLHCGQAGMPFAAPSAAIEEKAAAELARCKARGLPAGYCKPAPRPEHQEIDGIEDAVEVEVRSQVAVVVRADHDLTCVPMRETGALASRRYVSAPVRGVRGLTTSASDLCAIEVATGRPVCWGDKAGVSTASFEQPTHPPVPSAARNVGLSFDAACAVLDDGSLWCWDRLAPPRTAGRGEELKEVPLPAKASAASGLCVGLVDGRLLCTGEVTRFLPGKVPDLPPIAALSGGEESFCAVGKKGTLHCWGAGGRFGSIEGPTPVETPVPAVDVRVDGGSRRGHVCIQARGGDVLCTAVAAVGEPRAGGAEAGAASSSFQPRLSGVGAWAMGDEHVCGVKKGRLDCAPLDPPVGEPGKKAKKAGPPELPVPKAKSLLDVAWDPGSLLCARSSGTIVCSTNRNSDGQEGPRLSFGARSMALTSGHLVAADGQGRLYGWAHNHSDAFDTSSKQRHLAGHVVTKVWARHGDLCARTSRGRVLCSQTPINDERFDWSELDLDGVEQVAIAETATCALRRGEVWCWGGAREGQLGDGTAPPAFVEVPVADPAARPARSR